MKVHKFVIIACLTLGLILLLNHPAYANQGKTAAEAITDMDRILGDPEAFVENVWLGVTDFISEHFGALAVATGFGVSIRAITR